MKPKFNNFSVVFNVSSIERTERFYRDILGVDTERQPGGEEPDWLIAKTANGVELLFFEGKEEIGRSPIIVFELEEGYMETVLEEMSKAGVEIVTPVSEAPGGWSSDFLDPDGHPMAFYQSGELPLKRGE
ncbi:VOC family protein [Membranihabitans maritimus]|uniref:VOC family protein n=1 Tax=Membranihabitans maritimus TaxID=2904244 RepID=UPI001F3D868C|nr:VOC family protein [Membranihabitans maritimus]